jgi:hypothetical protein
MSSLFQNVVLAKIAYDGHQTRADTAQIHERIRALSELQQGREEAESQQQYLRDTIFNAKMFLEKDFPVLEPRPRLFWAAWFQAMLLQENITPQSFAGLDDKATAMAIIKDLNEKTLEAADGLPEEEENLIVNNARLAYALPVLRRLSLLMQLKGSLQSSFDRRMNEMKVNWSAALVCGVVLALLMKWAGIPTPLLGNIVFMTLVAYYPAHLYCGALGFKKLFLPRHWTDSLALADQCGVSITTDSVAGDIDVLIRNVEGQLPSVSESKADNPADYAARYKSALDTYNRVSERLMLGA